VMQWLRLYRNKGLDYEKSGFYWLARNGGFRIDATHARRK
jgi:mannose/cellobiose epimerase-like protein (N-acyl-D-glucosamine 2-epimerase family)